MKSSNYLNRFPAVFIVVIILILSGCSQDETDVQLVQDVDLIDFGSDPIEGQYIVVLEGTSEASKSSLRYKEGTDMMKRDVLAKFSELKLEKEDIIFTYGYALNGFTAKLDKGQLDKLQKDSRVIRIEQDQLITLGKPSWAGGGGDDPVQEQETPWGINRVNGGVNVDGKTAWVIDSGIDLDHPDLNVDVARSRSFLSGKDANDPNDTNGHGTHVAGTIAAIDNDQGVIGVAAGAAVVSVRVLNRRGSGSYSGVMAGVDYVGAEGNAGDVANMSLGGGVSEALDAAVVTAAAKGVIFCLAAGNDSDDANNYSPARAEGNNIVTVSASDINDNFASFSNYGNPPVDWCAPGVSIKSTWKNGDYNTISGTSMATPHVAGVLLIGVNNGAVSPVNDDPDNNADPIISH